ncbi:hypothetical protein A2572_03335 [Candidatus Collierbacteria bacterium RIFOXYD1_FULL_40_9]|uniref:Uncharacterized protein n=1 Tax=Candidatus Collierbacteria bacterium RIFOXYD1_FULL_40_9 TaxID=1817731 RepID=A0A1F5FX02_9BACT|nr:MAG: hypothetical protein A2572_03335 [Candidatus Collierbacteria bacterium RIFOXYD1_FULL_40_9]
MKFGLRVPSLKKRFAARTSVKRVVRHSLGIKMPRGLGVLTNPKKALYNKVYQKTSFGIGDLMRGLKGSTSIKSSSKSYSPVVNNNPFVLVAHSFTQLINTKEKFGRDSWIGLLSILGIICLFGNPILGLVFLGVAGFLAYKFSKEEWFRVKTNLAKAKKLLRKEKFEEATVSLREAISFEPENIELHYLLGVALHTMGEYEESLVHLKSYTDNNPDDLDAKIVLAFSYYKLNKYKEAIPLLQQVPQEHSNYLLAVMVLGDSFMGLKEYDMAIEVFKRGPVRKTNLDPYLLQLHYLLATAYKKKGSKTDAVREFKRVFAYDMNYRDVQKELAELE